MEQVLKLHHHDPNFPTPVLEKIRKFVGTSVQRGDWERGKQSGGGTRN